MSFLDHQLKSPTVTKSNGPFFPPLVQKDAAETTAGKAPREKSCERFFGDIKDLTLAAAKHFLDTEMPSLLEPEPIKFECDEDETAGGCVIRFKNGYRMSVYFTEDYIHVQRPSKEGEAKMGYCKYSYSCDKAGNITFKELRCLRTW